MIAAGDDPRRATCLWLARTAAFDTGLVARLAKAFGGFASVVEQPVGRLQGLVTANSAAREAIAATSRSGCWRLPAAGEERGVVTWVDALYPARLRDLFDPPPALFVCGRRWSRVVDGLRLPAVAVVGARSPSP